jgi:hypothetical protein
MMRAGVPRKTPCSRAGEALEAHRQAHEQTKSDARQAQAIANKRDKHIAALEAELRGEREASAASDQALTALRVGPELEKLS